MSVVKYDVKIVDSFAECKCDGCGRLPVASARLATGIKLCWRCAHSAFSALECVRNPHRMYLSEDGRGIEE